MHRTWDDADVLYMPKRRRDVTGGWGVWNKAERRFVTDDELTYGQAMREADRSNAANWAAEDATWD